MRVTVGGDQQPKHTERLHRDRDQGILGLEAKGEGGQEHGCESFCTGDGRLGSRSGRDDVGKGQKPGQGIALTQIARRQNERDDEEGEQQGCPFGSFHGSPGPGKQAVGEGCDGCGAEQYE